MGFWPEPVCGKISTFAESFRILAGNSGFLTGHGKDTPRQVFWTYQVFGTYEPALVIEIVHRKNSTELKSLTSVERGGDCAGPDLMKQIVICKG